MPSIFTGRPEVVTTARSFPERTESNVASSMTCFFFTDEEASLIRRRSLFPRYTFIVPHPGHFVTKIARRVACTLERTKLEPLVDESENVPRK